MPMNGSPSVFTFLSVPMKSVMPSLSKHDADCRDGSIRSRERTIRESMLRQARHDALLSTFYSAKRSPQSAFHLSLTTRSRAGSCPLTGPCGARSTIKVGNR
jgi:hypothetical protein